MTSEETVALVNLAELLIEKGVDAYTAMRKLGAEAGLNDAEMDAADARFAKVYTDPLAGGSDEIGDGPEQFPYDTDLVEYPDKKHLKSGDRIFQRPTGKFNVVPSGIGISIPADWRLIETIGE